jgi:DNA-binding transcriptional ArsR family regulator
VPHAALPAIFGALADPTRLAIVERLLSQGETSAGELAEPFAMSRAAVSKHLRVLEDAGLIQRRIDRQWRVCAVRPEAIRSLDAWVERYRAFWDVSLDRLAAYIDETENNTRES